MIEATGNRKFNHFINVQIFLRKNDPTVYIINYSLVMRKTNPPTLAMHMTASIEEQGTYTFTNNWKFKIPYFAKPEL